MHLYDVYNELCLASSYTLRSTTLQIEGSYGFLLQAKNTKHSSITQHISLYALLMHTSSFTLFDDMQRQPCMSSLIIIITTTPGHIKRISRRWYHEKLHYSGTARDSSDVVSAAIIVFYPRRAVAHPNKEKAAFRSSMRVQRR